MNYLFQYHFLSDGLAVLIGNGLDKQTIRRVGDQTAREVIIDSLCHLVFGTQGLDGRYRI